MNFSFAHFNFNVLDLERSLKFYKEALGLEPVRRKDAQDGSFTLVYLGDKKTGFELELTYLRDREEPYNLGELEYHLAMATEDMKAAHELHEKMGVICYENPDGYWIEIVPSKL